MTLTADGTSLGADDGIGVAMCLYLLQDDTLRHGPIRAIFTTNEEDGMDSMDIDPKYLDGDYLVNLDWETLGSLCNSCAGGDFFNYSHKAEWEKPIVGCKALTISFSGLLGGHSGVGINKGHANALVSIATLLAMLRQGGVSYRVASFSGGQAKNAIPAFGTATVVLSAAEEDRAKANNIYLDLGHEAHGSPCATRISRILRSIRWRFISETLPVSFEPLVTVVVRAVSS